MPLDPNNLEIYIEGMTYAVSARRIHEHMTLGQVNPFGRAVSSIRTTEDAEEVVDVMRIDSWGWAHLTGLTLASRHDKVHSSRVLGTDLPELRILAVLVETQVFVAEVAIAARRYAKRRAVRNPPDPFLPPGEKSDPFGVPSLRSRLNDFLVTQAQVKAKPAQWLGTIQNLTRKGLRSEELDRSGVIEFLDFEVLDSSALKGEKLAKEIDFSLLRLSIIQNVAEARSQLRFEPGSAQPVAKIKDRVKAQIGQERELRLYDSVLGYRIEKVAHATLWGDERHWQVVRYDGRTLKNRATRRPIFDSEEEAISSAQEHARRTLPKLLASEKWIHWSWTGGEEYREWLITLPFFPVFFHSSHFAVRNVLAHVRCDLREGADGERVLMLHEVQSDWMQEMRRLNQESENYGSGEDLSPFLNEWPALTLKLMLLHAAHLRVDALGWARGADQADRYRGHGEQGLRELYDRTLPREGNRMLKPFGLTCETVEIFVPKNFAIRRVEGRYQVRNVQGEVVGDATTFQEARALMPDGAEETLHPVHGVRLPAAARAAILERGFFAWG
jgi:hypothetical protein